MRYIIAKNVGLAWMFNITYSLALVAISAASVLWLCPPAAGSGVPEVMAYLNGCSLPKVRWCRAPLARPLARERRRMTPAVTHFTRLASRNRCLSGRPPPSSSCPARAAWAPGCPSGQRAP
jgi:hypothetical protein